MVQELNNFITMKKERSSAVDAKKELLAESSSRGQQKTVNGEWQASPAPCNLCTNCLIILGSADIQM